MDSSPTGLVLQLLLQFVLIFINAIFASAEIAIVSINDLKLEKMAMEGNKRAKRLMKLTNNPASFLATIQVAITLSGFLGSAFAADNFSDVIVEAILKSNPNLSYDKLNTVAVILITIILSYITLVFGELVPKQVAMKKTEKIALSLSGLIYVSSVIFTPIIWLLTKSTNLVLRILRINPNVEDDNVSEEEIRMMVDVGSQKGTIESNEKDMIVNVFEFNDKDCGEFSTHRKDIVALDLDDSLDEWEQTIKESTHSVFPIFKDSIDNIVLVLDAKKYFRLDDKSLENIKEKACIKPAYVPDTMKTDTLFEQMQKTHIHFAVVLDEYGGTVGIITMNDLLEEIVGDINERITEPDIVKMTDNSWNIKGLTDLDDVEQAIGVSMPTHEFETLSGYILSIYCKIPKDNDKFTVEDDKLIFNVVNTVERRVESCIVTVKPTDNEQQ